MLAFLRRGEVCHRRYPAQFVISNTQRGWVVDPTLTAAYFNFVAAAAPAAIFTPLLKTLEEALKKVLKSFSRAVHHRNASDSQYNKSVKYQAEKRAAYSQNAISYCENCHVFESLRNSVT